MLERTDRQYFAEKFTSIADDVDVAFKRIQIARKNARKTGRPLVILIGEEHTKPADHIFKALLINKLQAAGYPISVALELPHDTLYTLYRDHYRDLYDVPVSETVLKRMKHLDKSGHLTLKANFGIGGMMHAPISHVFFALFLLHKNLRLQFIDTSHNREGFSEYLDPSDKATRALLTTEGFAREPFSVETTDEAGVRLRNIFMAYSIADEISKNPDQIIFAPMGKLHVLGDTDISVNNSVVGLLRKQGFAVCPLERHGDLRLLSAKKRRIVKSLNRPEFDHTEISTAMSAELVDSDPSLEEEEIKHLSGYAQNFFINEDLKTYAMHTQKQWFDETSALFAHWMKQQLKGKQLTLKKG
jgi:hypothetical protein